MSAATAAPSGLTAAEYLQLALDCLDQAGFPLKVQREVEETLNDALPYSCDACGGFGCGACRAEAEADGDDEPDNEADTLEPFGDYDDALDDCEACAEELAR